MCKLLLSRSLKYRKGTNSWWACVTMYFSLVGMGRICSLDQELVLNGGKYVKFGVGSAKELL